MKLASWHDKNYKKILIVPIVLLALSLGYLLFFYMQTGDIIRKDVSLTGGTSITIESRASKIELENFLSGKGFRDYSVTSVSDNAGNQLQLIVTVQEERSDDLKSSLEEFLGVELTSENSSIETTSTSLSKEFYNQLIVAILIAFFWMSAVVFVIFAKGKKIKTFVIFLNLLFGFYMGLFFFDLPYILSLIIFFVFVAVMISVYIKNSVPAFAVMLSAFADIVMTLAVINLLGVKISTAGIVAFLMLIGYSVDTDILLTTRLLKKREGVNSALWGAFKTGITMTMTSIVAVSTALFVVYSFGSVLNQIFMILLIGLFFDIVNTWTTNASIIKWYVEKKL
jgi:preprotein translocase subunit SecF